MKLKELLKGRKKLREYDELTEWKQKFEDAPLYSSAMSSSVTYNSKGNYIAIEAIAIPDRIKEIITSALEAEIAKLDEE